MQIHELPTISGSIGSGGYFATDNGSQTTKIDYDALAQAIIEQYASSTLAGTAQSVKAALDGLDGNKLDLKAGTAITNGTDVNTLQTPGTYFCASASIAASLSNIPSQATAVGFRLDVARNGYNANNYLTQTLVGVRYGLSFEYVRGMSVQGTWGEWQKTPTRAEVDALNSNISSNAGGVPIREAGTVSPSASFSFDMSNALSQHEGFALVALQIEGNSAQGVQLLFLGRGTSKAKALLDGMGANIAYTATYSVPTWTITNNTENVLYYTVIKSK